MKTKEEEEALALAEKKELEAETAQQQLEAASKLLAAFTQAQVQQVQHKCPYQDSKDDEKACDFTTPSETVLSMHERAKHKKNPDEDTKDTKKIKRMETKLSKFDENESPAEFRRKVLEFERYARLSGIKEDEVSEDLYMACSTPMKKKVLASAKIAKDIISTKSKVMWDEIERLATSKTNQWVERQQFHLLVQDEDERINDFEARVRAKAALCGFPKGCKSKNCQENCCLIDAEEEMIKTIIMINMKDKATQRDLWKPENEGKNLEEILSTCRANEAIHTDQAALNTGTGHTVTGTIPKTCHKCGKTGHFKRACRKKSAQSAPNKVIRSCSFCGATARCKAKNCKGMDNKCNKCSLYGHLPNCCTEWTQSKARKSLENTKDANSVRDDE